MNLQLLRRPARDGICLGDLLADGVHTAFTAELDEDVIPPGNYPVTIARSIRWNRMLPIVGNVPGRAPGVWFHPGNSDTKAPNVIVLGLTLLNDTIEHAREAEERFQSLIAPELAHGRPVTLTVVQQPSIREVQA